MATVSAMAREPNVRSLSYPPGFSHLVHGCLGCRGLGGDCTAAVAANGDVVAFTLSDGRSGVVVVAVGADDATVRAAIQAWSTAHLLMTSALVGSVIL